MKLTLYILALQRPKPLTELTRVLSRKHPHWHCSLSRKSPHLTKEDHLNQTFQFFRCYVSFWSFTKCKKKTPLFFLVPVDIPFQVSARSGKFVDSGHMGHLPATPSKIPPKIQYTPISHTRSAIPPSPTMKGIESLQTTSWQSFLFFWGGVPLRCVGTTVEKDGKTHTDLPRFCFLYLTRTRARIVNGVNEPDLLRQQRRL